MEDYSEFKKANYGQNICAIEEGSVIFYSPDSQKDVVGADKMSYDEYLDVQRQSLGKIRSSFERCYFNYPMGFKGQIEKTTKDHVCFRRIFVTGMYSDGVMFDGKEDHVWVNKAGFEGLVEGDSVEFCAEVYRYVKTGNGKQIDYSLRNPQGIKKIDSYELPSNEELMLQEIDSIICETCFLSEQCNRMFCTMNPKHKKKLRKQMLDMMKSSDVE